MSDLIDRLRNDPVELVFGIATVGGVIILVVFLFFYDPSEILGMSRGFLIVLTILGIAGVRVGLQVVRVFRQFM
ncbi:MAG: hypothetical protein ACXADH_04960 [Candidatus Kariarchaeaceae archaeon]|jgi:lipid-A-disaccharide synthase-like uncharacterized protein